MQPATRLETDIALAAALIMDGNPVLDVRVLTDKKTQVGFIFQDTIELKLARQRFHNGSMKVSPEDFTIQMKKLKTRAYSEMRNNEVIPHELFPNGDE